MQVEFKEENIKLLNKHITVDKKFKENVELMLEGKFQLNRGLELVEFGKYPDWNYEHPISANTYQLYMHTLNFIKSFVKSYKITNNSEHISYAKKLIENWIANNLDNHKNRYVWYDHAVSSRIWNLLYFQGNAPKKYKIKDKVFMKIYHQHLDFLRKYKNYTENNHGIMMDRALILSSIFLKNKELKDEYILLAKNRIEKAIYRDYSYKNVHLENSPDYHRMVTSWLNRASKLLNEVGYPLPVKLKKKLEKAVQFNGVIVNYNNEYPMIGDTEHSKIKINKKHYDFIDYEAGLAILNERSTQSTLVFNCGFQNLTHKHYDDLSLTLSLNKEQILVDSGKYNYNSKDELRNNIISPKAHSTLLVSNQLYDLNKNDKIRLLSYNRLENYRVLKGVNNAYNDTFIERIIILVDNDIYIIVDKLKSNTQQVYVNNFIFHDSINVNRIGIKEYQLTTPTSKNYILKDHSTRAVSVLFENGKGNSNISKKFNELTGTNRLEIRKKKNVATFLTSVVPMEKSINSLKIEDGFVLISLDSKEMKIPIE